MTSKLVDYVTDPYCIFTYDIIYIKDQRIQKKKIVKVSWKILHLIDQRI